MLGRHRKLNFGATGNEEQSESCVLLGSTAVYRRLMDPSSSYSSSVYHFTKPSAEHSGNEEHSMSRKRFEKSESEDSGVELPPPSPFGSESSYNPEESESAESSNPEDQESLESPTHEESLNHKSPAYGKTNNTQQSQEAVTVRRRTSQASGSINMHSHGDLNRMDYFVNKQLEKDTTDVPHKLEQAIIRSRRQRSSSREAIQNRAARCNRQYPGSLKEQRRGKPFSHPAKSQAFRSMEKEDQDPLVLPGDGLNYLENLCQMLEQIADLQRRNQMLHHEKKEMEKKLCNQVLFLDSCVCGSSRDSCDLEQDMADGHHPGTTPWRPQHYRKRSSSHAGVLFTLARQTENTLREKEKMNPQYVSVPNLQQAETQRTNQNYKPEASQWFKVKDLLSKLTRKNSRSSPSQATRSNYRNQTILEETPQHPKRLFLPGFVIRPPNHGRQLH
ncbi:uncharacterized protein C8orf58 homolog isoform X2 [Hyperolius riggenbachi]|uniref:uncharacterized protein C8orf58 homolog isoform X2 n=1 Tax=Hyperolius riggenbachi TaxID=752182 RepID=UPI0035A2C5BD